MYPPPTPSEVGPITFFPGPHMPSHPDLNLAHSPSKPSWPESFSPVWGGFFFEKGGVVEPLASVAGRAPPALIRPCTAS